MLDGDGKVASSGLHTNVHEIKQHTSGSVRSLLSIGHTSSNSLSRKKNGKNFYVKLYSSLVKACMSNLCSKTTHIFVSDVRIVSVISCFCCKDLPHMFPLKFWLSQSSCFPSSPTQGLDTVLSGRPSPF